MVVGGSCWWGVEDTVPASDPFRKWLLDLLRVTPGRFASLLGVPVIHASHAGRFKGRSWPGKPRPFTSSYLGETQIVDRQGDILARMALEEGEGLITADLVLGEIAEPREAIPSRFWIPEMPAEEIRPWQSQLESGHEYYVSNTRPALKRRFERKS
jgi:hypothetical protein